MASLSNKSGKCSNFGNCSLADARTAIEVPSGVDFVCTECGKPLLLIDAGCEFDSYAADISRTYPVNGRFSPAQRDLYALVLAAQQAVFKVHASEPLLDYLQALIAATRSGVWFTEGLSPRAGIAVLRVARARALLLSSSSSIFAFDAQPAAAKRGAHSTPRSSMASMLAAKAS